MIIISNVAKDVKGGWEWGLGPVVKRSERKSIISTENGQVSSLRVTDGTTGSYHLQFITLEPNSLFLPVVLHSDMVFYVHTGINSFIQTFLLLISLIYGSVGFSNGHDINSLFLL